MNPQPPVIDNIVERIKRNPRVEKIILFGSRARGDERERSDIDLAVVAPELTQGEWSELWTYVDEEAPTLLKIDLVLWREASGQIQESIAREGVILYERQ